MLKSVDLHKALIRYRYKIETYSIAEVGLYKGLKKSKEK